MGGVVERPVVEVHLAGEHVAGLVGVAADGDDGFYLVFEEKVHVLRVVADSVDPDFLQGADRAGMDVSGGIRTGALDAEIFTEGLAENGFGEVGAAGIACAEDEDCGRHD